jgi:hypothetical protein
MSAEDMVKGALLGHIDEHFTSIRKTIGGWVTRLRQARIARA